MSSIAAGTGGGGGGGGGRMMLTQNTTFNVTKAGNDHSGTGTVAKPWLTIQHAVNVVTTLIDPGDFRVTIQIGDGTYDEYVICGAGIFSGNNSVDSQDPPFIIQGNAADNTAVKIAPTIPNTNHSGGVVNTVAKGLWWYRFLNVDGTNATGGANTLFYTTENSFCLIDDCAFGSIPNGWFVYSDTLSFSHVFSGTNSTKISATNAAGIMRGDYFATMLWDGVTTFTTGGIAFSDSIFYADLSSWLLILSTVFVNAGVATGRRFESVTGSLITALNDTSTPTFPAITALPGSTDGIVDGTSWYTGTQGAFQKAGLPAATDIVAGSYAVIKDTSGGGVYLCYNDAGIIKKVALT